MLLAFLTVAVYGYISFNKAIKEKKTIDNYTEIVFITELIQQELLKARVHEKVFLQSGNPKFAAKLRINILHFKLDSYRLLKKLKGTGEQSLIDDAEEIVIKIEEYLDLFALIELAFLERGFNESSGLQQEIKKTRLQLLSLIPTALYHQIKSLELNTIYQYLNENSVKNQVEMDKLIKSKPDLPLSVITKLREYLSLFSQLIDNDIKIRKYLENIEDSSNLILDFVDSYLKNADFLLQSQKELSDKLIEQQNANLLFLIIIGVSIFLLTIRIIGREPLELASAMQEQSAILEAISDGIVAVNRKGDITVINQRAREILDIKNNVIGKHIFTLFPNSRLLEVMQSGKPEFFKEQKVGKITIITTRVPIRLKDKITGGVASFREKGELARLAEELTQVKQYINALRANNHEFQNKLHTIQGMIQLGQHKEVIHYVQEVRNSHSKKILLYLDNIKEPKVSSILLGKYNLATELGISFFLDEESKLERINDCIDVPSLVSIIGNLIQNAIEAVGQIKPGKKCIWVKISESDKTYFITVKDSGPGIAKEDFSRIFDKGFSTKVKSKYTTVLDNDNHSENMGMGLYITQNKVANLNGRIQFNSDNETVFEVIVPKPSNIF